MSKTPITDDAVFYAGDVGEQIVRAFVSRRIERDRAELIEALEQLASTYRPDSAIAEPARALLARMKESK